MIENDSILREIDEDMRRERLKGLWRQFGSYIIGVSAAVILATVGTVVWQNRQRERNLENTTRFMEASELLQAGKYKEAADMLAGLRKNSGAGLAALAGLREAQARSALGDTKAAQQLLGELAADRAVDAGLKDMAGLFAYSLSLKNDSPTVRVPQVHPAFAATAHELSALARIKENHPKEAAAELLAVKNDANAPASVRERANLLLSHLDPASVKAAESGAPDAQKAKK